MPVSLPIGFESWPIKEKQKYLGELKQQMEKAGAVFQKHVRGVKRIPKFVPAPHPTKRVVNPAWELMSVKSIFRKHITKEGV